MKYISHLDKFIIINVILVGKLGEQNGKLTPSHTKEDRNTHLRSWTKDKLKVVHWR